MSCSPTPDVLTALPGGDVVRTGLRDLERNQTTVASCLAAIASPYLVKAGLLKKTITLGPIDSEHTLYHLLGELERDPYAAYRSRLQELASFENALEHRLRREAGLPA